MCYNRKSLSFHLDLSSFFGLFFYPVRDEVVEAETVGEVVHLPRVLGVVYLWKLEGWWTNLH